MKNINTIKPMHLLVGLGNPEPKYSDNRHNVGFMIADAIAEHYKSVSQGDKFSGNLSKCKIDNSDSLLLKPMTYMNLSGVAVGKAARFYKIPPENIIVFYDELDLDLGRVKIKQNGGHGGHNGIKSIDEHVGKNYHRVRVGIGRPEHKSQVTSHVLSDFLQDEFPIIDKTISSLIDVLPLIIAGDSPEAMNKIALSLSEQKRGEIDGNNK